MSLLDELKQQREDAQGERDKEQHSIDIRMEWVRAYDDKIADLDKAISALTPPLQHKGGETEAGDSALAEFMKRPGAVAHDDASGFDKIHNAAEVEVLQRNGEVARALMCTLLGWNHSPTEDSALDILAYRILSQPETAELQTISTLQASSGEGETDGPGEPVAAEDMALPEGFIRWSGGACPVGNGVVVDIICRDPRIRVGQTNQVFAHMINWENEGNPDYDIIAYRVVEPADESAAYSPVNNADEPFIDDTVARAAPTDTLIAPSQPINPPSFKYEGSDLGPATRADADFFSKAILNEAQAKQDKPALRLFGFGRKEEA